MLPFENLLFTWQGASSLAGQGEILSPPGASLVAQMVRSPPAMQETWIQPLSQECPLEKEWLPIPVFLPGESREQRNLEGYSPWGHRESDVTE